MPPETPTTETPTTETPTTALAKQAKPKESPEHWRKLLRVDRAIHDGTVVFAGWDVHAKVTEPAYKSRLAAFQRSPA